MFQTVLLVVFAQVGDPLVVDAGSIEVDAGTVDVDAGAIDAGIDEDDKRLQTVVTGSRTERKLSEVVVPTEVITRTQIEQLGVRDLGQLLQQHAGVEMVYTNRGVGIRLQGLDPEYVLVLVDGQRIAGRAGTITDVTRFSLRDLERVEIVKGPAAALYGADAVGGVINLITRRPQRELELSLRAMGGGFQNGSRDVPLGTEADLRAHAATKLGAFELRGGAGFRHRTPFDRNPDNVADNGPGIRRFDYDVDVSWNPSDTLRAWSRTSYAWTDLRAVDENDTGAVFNRAQRTEQLDSWLGVRNIFEKTGTTLTVRGHFGFFKDQFQLDQRNSRKLDDYSQTITRLFEGYVQVDQKLGSHLLTAGAEVLSENLSSSRLVSNFVQRGRFGLFVQDSWTLVSNDSVKLSVEPGLRGDLDSQFGAAPSPRLAFKIDAGKSLTFRAGWGLGFRPPSFNELYLRFCNTGIGYCVDGSPGLVPERSGSVNIAVDYRLPIEGWTVSASAWHTSLTNLINITASGIPNPDNPTIFSYENVAGAYTQGAEVNTRLKVSKGVSVDLSYMGLDARDVTRNRPLEGRSSHRVNASVNVKYRPTGLEAVVRSTWNGPRPFYVGTGLGFANVLGFGETRTVQAPGYFDLEVQVTWALRQWFKIFLNGYNLLNAGDADFNPRPPRGALAGVSLEY
ncbi:MAG: TonB-dependent receptor [Myxococcales bacterium]|nr:TonB-dependent receptor [Myxococcales bacterium]